MRLPSIRPMVLFSLLLCIAIPVLAQVAGTTSSLIGTVTTDGKPLPGVTVTVSSPALQGVRTTVTGDGGGYTFAALPPGAYNVTFELEGMQKITHKVALALASTQHVDSAMKPSAVTEAITVTASATPVLETTQVGANFKQEAINLLPVARDMRQTVLLSPGVNPNGVNNQITINGGPSYDNVFMVNGVVVNENLRGQPHSLFIEDAIQETAVMTSGISAEYGRFTGGVVSTLTKSGGNEYNGTFRDSLKNAAWTDDVSYPGRQDHPGPSLVLCRRSCGQVGQSRIDDQDEHRVRQQLRREALRRKTDRRHHAEAQRRRFVSQREERRDQQLLPPHPRRGQHRAVAQPSQFAEDR
jgi:hypothetical protein